MLAEGPDPAVVAIRSDPDGALVYRNGEALGATPISLLVKPDEEFVRIELHMDGYQPLAAELTAKDGERLLTLSKESRPLARAVRPRRADAAHTAQKRHAPTTAAAKPSGTGPYERFE